MERTLPGFISRLWRALEQMPASNATRGASRGIMPIEQIAVQGRMEWEFSLEE